MDDDEDAAAQMSAFEALAAAPARGAPAAVEAVSEKRVISMNAGRKVAKEVRKR